MSDVLSAEDWEPDQSHHAMWCGMQGSHSDGAGQKGSCTCGRDALVSARRSKADKYAERVLRAIDRKGPNWVNSDMERLGLYRAISRLDQARKERRSRGNG